MDIKRVHLTTGFYFSPGYFLAYWRKYIAKLPDNIIYKDVRLKQYREMFLGAHIAALQTKLTSMNHFVGLPADEPPDVNVVRFSPSLTKNGKEASNFDTIRIEVTRCDMEEGENALTQILNKNKPGYAGMTLAVHTSGNNKSANLEEVYKSLKEQDKIYPREILIFGPAVGTRYIRLLPGTYSVSKVWPDRSSDLVYQLDSKAFFKTPEVITTTGRGASREAKLLGFVELLPPKLT